MDLEIALNDGPTKIIALTTISKAPDCSSLRTALKPLGPSTFPRGLFVILFSFAVLHAPLAIAQTGSASLSGTIVDRQGGLVPDARVSIVNTDTNATFDTKTNKAGVYNAPSLSPGRYRILVSKEGFKQIDLREVVLNTQDSVNRNFTLDVGGTSETVVVNANAEHMPTDDPALGLLVNRDFIENMPLNGRSLQDLIDLAPGVVSNGQSQTGNAGSFSVNGQRDDSNYYTVDGVAANLNPVALGGNGDLRGLGGVLPAQTALGTTQSLISVDALQEFKIQTAGYSAENGRQPGGQIELTSRSGTNSIHGSLYDYFRNEALDANSWYFNHNAIPRQQERQNDFGGTIGGPLEIPHVYNGRNKTFYFVSYEGLRLKVPNFSGVLNVPSMELRQFAATSVQPFLSASPLPNGPANGDECALSLGYTFSCTAQWTAGYSDPSSIDSMSFRVDQVIGSKTQLFARYSDTSSFSAFHNYGSELDAQTNNMHTWTFGAATGLRPNLTDELRFNYSVSGGEGSYTPVSLGGAVPYSKDLVVPSPYTSEEGAAGEIFMLIPGSNYFYTPIYYLGNLRQRQYNLLDGLTWTKGNHAWKFGADFRRLSPQYNPSLYYTDLQLLSIQEIQQGYASAAYVGANRDARPTFTNLSLYAQDHWKLTPRLTLDYGLRWEFNPAPGASDGVYPLALTSSNLATATIAPSGTPQYRTVYHDFAPRLGFAFNVVASQSHPLVLRAATGIFFDTGQALGADGYHNYPFNGFIQVPSASFPIVAAEVPPPSLNLSPVKPYPFLNGISDPNLKLPYTEQWNISLDQGLGAKNTFTLAYIGNEGKKLLFNTQYGQNGTPYPPNPAFTSFNFVNNAASSSYNAFQVQDQGYVITDMQLIASYSWSHAIDNASSDNLSGNFAPRRGNSVFDLRQVFNAAVNYKVRGSGSSRFVRALTDGWLVVGRFAAQTGPPFDVYADFYTLDDGSSAYITPDRVPGVPLYLHNVPGVLGGWGLNPAAFTGLIGDGRTPPGTIPVGANGVPLREGTLGRNYLHGPNFWNLNAGIQRNFPIHEKLTLNFRVDAFNIFNHPNASWENVDTYLPDTTFGMAGGGSVATFGNANSLYATGSPRSLQLELKLQF
jgi:carboxypeptidase family protein